MAVESPSPFGALLKRYRVAARLTQEALAERAGLSARGISDLERGVNHAPRQDTLALLAVALGLSTRERDLFAAAAFGAPPSALLAVEASSGQPAPASGQPALVGREAELEMLARHLSPAVQGAPPVLLCGEPGIGKSRLLHEAAQQAQAGGWTVLRGGCQRHGGQEPYAPLLGALEQHIQTAEVVGLRAALRGCAWLVRLLPELAEGPIEPLPGWTVSAEQERRLVFGAVRRYLGHVAGPAGTLLVLDDLQWAGEDALTLLRALVQGGADPPLRVVGAYRDTEVGPQDALSVLLADLAQARLAVQQLVTPLADGEASVLVAALLGEAGPAGEQERQALVRRAGGVPFFLVSLAQGLQAHALEGAAGEPVPWDVAQSVRQRVAALPLGTRALLGVAAVAGREGTPGLLVGVTGQDEGAVVAGLEAAYGARLLEEVGPAGYRFAHDIVREVVEGELSAGRRRLLHRAIARALEGLPGEPAVEALAYHYTRAEEPALAAHWLERAGDEAVASLATAAAMEHYLAARAQLAALEAEAAALARLDEKLGDLQVRTGDYAAAQSSFERARAVASTPEQRATLWHKEGVTWKQCGDFDRALAAYAAADAEGDAPGSPDALPLLRVTIEVSRAEAHDLRGDYPSMGEALGRARALLDVDGQIDLDQLVLALSNPWWAAGPLSDYLAAHDGALMSWAARGYAAWARDDLAEAQDSFRRHLALRERLGNLEEIGLAWDALGEVTVQTGQLIGAIECYQRGLAAAEQLGHELLTAWIGAKLGDVLLHQGRLDLAEERFRFFQAATERSANQEGLGLSWKILGEVALARGSLAQADDLIRRGMAILEGTHDDDAVSECLGHLGQVTCERGDLRGAISLCRAARRRAHDGPRGRSFMTLAMLVQASAVLRQSALPQPSPSTVRAAAALLARARGLISRPGWMRLGVRAALLAAELALQKAVAGQGALGEAHQAIERVVELAAGEQLVRDEALARCLLGRCALLSGDTHGAQGHLRAALSQQVEMGTALEAARTRLLLAGALAQGAESDGLLPEAQALLAAARTQFATSGAALDLAEAERLAAAWAGR